jgi:catechol 2,3-dioxygenase-like lactoylglutathione lyase family enzyme
MPRGLDHIVHAVRDLDAAAEFYRRAGFTVGARNRHPWGTHNHIVQLEGFFIEILTVAEPELLDRDTEHRELARLFGAFNRDSIAARLPRMFRHWRARASAARANCAFRARARRQMVQG